jgi:hypothetical protein
MNRHGESESADQEMRIRRHVVTVTVTVTVTPAGGPVTVDERAGVSTAAVQVATASR